MCNRHQAANVVSLREFTNNAFNQHHGMQSTERFGLDRFMSQAQARVLDQDRDAGGP
jgi:hypothetical protein